jgi:hypothetical protein
MHVPKAGNDELAVAVHDLRACGRSAILRDAHDRLAADGHGAVWNDASVDNIDDVHASDRQLSRLGRDRAYGDARRGQ